MQVETANRQIDGGETTPSCPEDSVIDSPRCDDTSEAGADNASHTGGRRVSTTAGLVALAVAAVIALGALIGWLGFEYLNMRRSETHSSAVVAAANRTATALTTIDWQHPEADVQRILDGAGGKFHDDFQQRAPGFIDLVKRTKSQTVGKVTEAGVESTSGEGTDVLVSVSVVTTTNGQPDQQPRAWRMKLTVQGSGKDLKVTNVAFVS